MPEEVLQVVNENDQSVGGATRRELKINGLKYRIVRISVEDEAGNILIQKRVPTKDTYPNCWDNSAAGHVDEGESYEAAAKRELEEEIGLSNAELVEIDYYYSETTAPNGYYLNRFTKVYRVIISSKTSFTLQPEEVSEVKWATVSDIADHVERGDVSDGLLQIYQRIYAKRV